MNGVEPVTIHYAARPPDFARARELFVEYAQWLRVDLCFQGFSEELATLPGAYAPPRGRLLLAGPIEDPFGCIALRPLVSTCESRGSDRPVVETAVSAKAGANSARPEIGEVKRLYVQPAHRGEGWGRHLAEALIADARTIGYQSLKLDTLGWMTDARRLYAKLGFRECAPYYDNPTQGVVYMELQLAGIGEK